MFRRIDPVKISAISGSANWTDKDLSSYVSDKCTGVVIRCVNNTTLQQHGIRCNGSTDDRKHTLSNDTQSMICVGVDEDKIIEQYYYDGSTQEQWLTGYFEDEAVFFTNGVDKTPASAGSYQDVDISSDTGDDTAIIAIFEHYRTNDAGGYHAYWRCNGSTDDRYYYIDNVTMGVFVGVDGNEVCEAKHESVSIIKLYLLGYIKAHASANVDATDISLSATNTDTDIDCGDNIAGAVVEVYDGSGSLHNYKIMHEDDTNSTLKKFYYHNYVICGVNTDGELVGRIDNTAVDFFLVGTLDKYVEGYVNSIWFGQC